MSGKSRVGGLKVKHVEAALLAEEQALTTIHVAVTKQLRRLEVEEQLLQEMLKRTEQEQAAEARQVGRHVQQEGQEGQQRQGGRRQARAQQQRQDGMERDEEVAGDAMDER